MHRPAKLVIAGFLAALGASAHAGYAQLAPPPGFSGTPGGWKYAPAANDQSFGRVVYQPNGLKVPVPGATTTMPASYRWAANAPRVAAKALYLVPQVRTAVNIALWLAAAGIVWDAVNNRWTKPGNGQQSTGLEYSFSDALGWHGSLDSACQSLKSVFTNPRTTFVAENEKCTRLYDGQYDYAKYDIRTRGSTCPIGWYVTPAGCLQHPPGTPITEEEFLDRLAPKPMPERVPFELPYPTPLPIEHPSPFINPAPGPDPAHRPRFVPSGDPVPNPNYDPQAQPSPENEPYIQPGTRIKPSPTPDNPWRVEIEPVNIPTPSPEPQPEIDDPSPDHKPKPEDQQSLCEKHPDIVACAKMDEVEPEDVNNEDKTLTITPKGGWGNESATCPAPVTRQVAGLSLEMSWQPFCDFAGGIRPVVIAMAWLSAALFVLGVARRD